jgi:hypothetical protein
MIQLKPAFVVFAVFTQVCPPDHETHLDHIHEDIYPVAPIGIAAPLGGVLTLSGIKQIQ